MSDIKPKSPSIPQWQQSAAATTNTGNSTSTPSPSSDETPRSELIEQAKKFLQDDSIRDAPIDRKIAFLESKGLRSEEIDSLLAISRETDSSTNLAEGSKSTPDSTTSSTSNESQSPKEPSALSPISSASSPTTPAAPTATKNSTPRDVPPIITYPEFLMQQSKPPPLVTLRSILYTLYGAAGLGASLYGASEYLVKPMLATLTSARVELAQTANANLQKLNKKLEQNVSRIPPHLSAKDTKQTEPADSEDDEQDSVTSDPTELFHRDVATQTSQDLDVSTLPHKAGYHPADEATPDPTATVNTHIKRLENITSHLREVASSEKESGALDDSMRTRLNELHHYLDGLLYGRSSYSSVTAYGVYSTPGLETTSGPSVGISKAEEDAMASFRADIRGVKGALLSARNFPASRGRIGSGILSGR
ncbi:hypothetical protein KXV51_009492 [Aspergillus fumigatus]|nr:hypothetical protein KXX01_007359 [Aspergillus fumigatus]KAH2686124.1 hypothetical protein KXV51_009492 [Aspergillus fumigatus]KAH3477815.1 hypothetical protein KXW89_009163 [Aspergillus fumigatus]